MTRLAAVRDRLRIQLRLRPDSLMSVLDDYVAAARMLVFGAAHNACPRHLRPW